MKKAIIFSLAFMTVFAMSGLTAFATTMDGDQNNPLGLTTGFTISSAETGDDPLVKVKWEEEKAVTSLESGDSSHSSFGSQFLPPLVKDADKMITICTVVTDDNGLGTIATVKAWVNAPQADKYCAPNEFSGPYILSSEYNPQTEANAAIARFQTAVDADLVTYNEDRNIDYTEVMQELNNGSAEIYCGDFPLNYEDPAGEYGVEIKAQDTTARWGTLTNTFDYIGVAGFEVDFSQISYNTVSIGDEKMVDGDTIFSSGDGLPTVRSIGNMRLKLTVEQDEMGLPLESDVKYAARMGDTSATKVTYNPNVRKTLPDILELSSESKMDFWITVFQTIPNQDTYSGNITLGCVSVAFEPCVL